MGNFNTISNDKVVATGLSGVLANMGGKPTLYKEGHKCLTVPPNAIRP